MTEPPAEAVSLTVQAYEIEPADWFDPDGHGNKMVTSTTTPLDDKLPITVRFTDDSIKTCWPFETVTVIRPIYYYPSPKWTVGLVGMAMVGLARILRSGR